MKLSNFIDGLQILRSHYANADGYHIGAEHDQFYVYATETPLSEDEEKRLRQLGWFQPDIGDGAPYDPAEGWSAFT